jgi:hypothetical protein
VRPLSGGIDAGLDRFQAQDGPAGVLVAHGHEDGGLDADGDRLVAGRGIRRHRGHGIFPEVQEPKADQRVPEAEHGPGRAEREADE